MSKQVLVVVLSLVVLGGCDDDGATEAGSCSRALANECPPGTAPECEGEVVSGCSASAGVDVLMESGQVSGFCRAAGSMRFVCVPNPAVVEVATQCLERGGDLVVTSTEVRCATAVGSLETGNECDDDRECVPGTSCFSVNSQVQVGVLCPLWEKERCWPGGVGKPCDREVGPGAGDVVCGEGLRCVWNGNPDSGVCAPMGKEGEACCYSEQNVDPFTGQPDQPSCRAGLVCGADEVCHPVEEG